MATLGPFKGGYLDFSHLTKSQKSMFCILVGIVVWPELNNDCPKKDAIVEYVAPICLTSIKTHEMQSGTGLSTEDTCG